MIPISLIKTPRLKEVEKLAQITDSSNSDGCPHFQTKNYKLQSP